MSATKHYIDKNCYYDNVTGGIKFIDGYEEKAPTHIMQQRLKNAGLTEKSPQNKVFKYDCSDLERHEFYQRLHNEETLSINTQWYNTYLEMVHPSNWVCVVEWSENGKMKELLVDFVVVINKDKFAFWFDEEYKQYYCRKGIEFVLPI
ncbi:MAG: hypothetical protein HC815_05810 [Richelia sp. RM1_1_1]|nr:hypothetical protein [Richelia sp. RM1_1_1]